MEMAVSVLLRMYKSFLTQQLDFATERATPYPYPTTVWKYPNPRALTFFEAEKRCPVIREEVEHDI